MTAEEARSVLKIQEIEEAEDAFEQAVFEIRQFVITRPALLKTFQDKQKKLAQLFEAMTVLEGEIIDVAVFAVAPMKPSENLQEHFSGYYRTKGEIKQFITSAKGLEGFSRGIAALIDLERSLIIPFSETADWTTEAPVIGKEPDPMIVLQLLREQSEKGRKTVAALAEVKNELPNELLLALKRLSLLKNYLHE